MDRHGDARITDFIDKYNNDILKTDNFCHRIYYEILGTNDWNIILQILWIVLIF